MGGKSCAVVTFRPTGLTAAPDTGHGKPLLNGCAVSWPRLMGLDTNKPIIQGNLRIVRHSCNTRRRLCGTDTLSAGNCGAIWLLESRHFRRAGASGGGWWEV